jgi:hypothetical protein
VDRDPSGLANGPGFLGAKVVATSYIGFATLIPAQPDRGIDAEPGLAWDRSGKIGTTADGLLYLVFTDLDDPTVIKGNSDTDIYLTYSKDGGATWVAPFRVNDHGAKTSQFLPAIAVDQKSGYAAITWYDARNDQTNNSTAQIYGTVTTDGALSFLKDQLIGFRRSDSSKCDPNFKFNFGDYTGLDYYNGAFYPVWADNGNVTEDNPDGTLKRLDLYTAKVTLVDKNAPLRFSVSSSLNPSIFGQAVKFTATVGGDQGTPTGSVLFLSDGAVIGSGSLDASGMATFTTPSLPVGFHQILAIYAGDGNFDSGISDPLTQEVDSNGLPGVDLVSVGYSSSPVNLTDPNLTDWAHWPGYDHKVTGGKQISDYTPVPGGGGVAYSNDARLFSWTDGTPTSTSTGNSSGVAFFGDDNGFTLTVPANPAPSTLTLYIGGTNSEGHLTAHLSDFSFADVQDYSLISPGAFDGIYTLVYSSASAAQTLTITWVQSTDIGGGNVTLQAATLAGPNLGAPRRKLSGTGSSSVPPSSGDQTPSGSGTLAVGTGPGTADNTLSVLLLGDTAQVRKATQDLLTARGVVWPPTSDGLLGTPIRQVQDLLFSVLGSRSQGGVFGSALALPPPHSLGSDQGLFGWGSLGSDTLPSPENQDL